MSAADDMLSERLLKAVEIAEEIVDEELRNCEDPSDEDLKLIRRKRCMELKEKQRQKQVRFCIINLRMKEIQKRFIFQKF